MSPVIIFFGDEIYDCPAIHVADDPLSLLLGEPVDSNYYPFQHQRFAVVQ
jgi:hypothetical protein